MVDNKWVVDDNQPKTNNNLGGENNVMSIDEDDFEVFDALDKDLASSNAGEALRGAPNHQPSHDTPNDRELERLRTFSQEIPDRNEFAKAHNPPALPPHLLQVILNKDTPVQCDPNVLPEPNHVMLNHLYALSIKDGVMVLSATHRHMSQYTTVIRSNTKKRKAEGVFELLTLELEVQEIGGLITIILRILPLESIECAILVDYMLTIDKETIEVKKDLWEPGKLVLEKHTANSGPLVLMASTIQLLSPVDLSRPSAYRNFEVRLEANNIELICFLPQCGPYNFHVDLRLLAELGGPLFTSWKVKQEAGLDFVEVTEISPEDVKILLHATARFGSIVIHKDNFLVMSILASQYRMLTVLREVESYLIAAKMPLIRKLEFAAELRMARLYDMTMREIGPNAVEELHRYLRDNGDRLQDVHWMLRSALGLNNDYVCIPW
ncbi:5'-AMP-activated protein kinase, beta subunit, complex-interacting region [Ancylostoma caninum]|uniref:5'-AMP-activated protein kinase subunit beta-1 n=1 Tax=Ancylostoma caninum TaxID=29170 RepID=A0A368FUL5_ANCCA|nr:5'-AMP-activated protein kinase, beta subunit, complex-interacting region [Ancylostoma caninum]